MKQKQKIGIATVVLTILIGVVICGLGYALTQHVLDPMMPDGPSTEQIRADLRDILSENEYAAIHDCLLGGMYAYKPYTGGCRVRFLIKRTGDIPVFDYQQLSDGTWELIDWYWDVDEF